MPDPIRGAPWYGRTFVAMLILLLLISVAVRWRLDPVAPLGSDAAVGEFSAARAAKTLATVLGDEQPHPVDSHGANGVHQRIVSELEDLSYQVDVQDTTSCRKYRYSTCARVRNLVAVHEGASQGQAMLLSAHYEASAGSIGLPTGNLAVVSKKAVIGGREVTAQVNAGPSSHKFMIMIPRLAGLSAVEMDGQIVGYVAGDPLLQEHFVFVCQGESCDGKQIKLTLTSQGPQPALLARVTAGVPEQFNAIARSRDLQTLSYGDGDHSVVLSAISL